MKIIRIFESTGMPPLLSWDTPCSVSGVVLNASQCDATAKKLNGLVE
jgi:hypothetical protein